MPSSSFLADAVLLVSQSGSLTADATVVARHFTGDAWIIGERVKHHRVHDHYGAESDLVVVLSSDVGPYVAYTPIHWVLADMLSRLEQLENANRRRSSFTGDAWLAVSGTYGRGTFTADAMFHRDGMTGSFTGDAWFTRGGSFTGDAWIQATFTGDAYIIATPP